MSKKKPARLGKGLDALLSSGVELPSASNEADSATNGKLTTEGGGQSGGLTTLPVEYLKKGQYQPRSQMNEEALDELAASIKAQGIVQPIIVRRIQDKQYEIIAGHRRWRAAQLAGVLEVPVVIRDIPEQAAMAMSLIENIQREDLNPVEEAMALERLQSEFQLTHDEIAETIGRSRSAVTNLLRLLKLTPSVRHYLEQGDLEMGHARALLSLSEEEQVQAAKTIIQKGLTVRQAETLVKKYSAPKVPPKAPTELNADVKNLVTDLSERIGAQVELKSNAQGDKGKLIISYFSLDELDGILAKIK